MSNLFTLDRSGENNGGQVRWTEEQLNYLVEDYNTNHSIPKLAESFKVSAQCIRSALRNKGVKILSLSELHTLDYPRDSHFFDIIDTAEKAYWLGFLYADGSIGKKNEVRLNLKLSDKKHVQKFLNAIKAYNHKISISSKRVDDKIFYMAHASIKDTNLHDQLVKKGCMNNKTFDIQWPDENIVPENLMSHFTRGYFDGDGCLTWSRHGKNRKIAWKLGFTCGSKDFIIGLKKWLGKEHLAYEDRGTYYILSINGNLQLTNILKKIYEDATEEIWLDRKKQKYDEFLLQSFGGEPVNTGCE